MVLKQPFAVSTHQSTCIWAYVGASRTCLDSFTAAAAAAPAAALKFYHVRHRRRNREPARPAARNASKSSDMATALLLVLLMPGLRARDGLTAGLLINTVLFPLTGHRTVRTQRRWTEHQEFAAREDTRRHRDFS